MRVIRIVVPCLIGLMFLFVYPCHVCAQADSLLYVLDTLLVDDNHYPKIGSTVPLQQFSGDELKQLGVTNVGDAMKFMSGITVKDYGGVGGLKTVSVRGMGAQHTAVFFDGVAVGDCQSGMVDLGRFSTDNLEGLQLTIGDGDDIYRPARMLASAGALSINTSMPCENVFQACLRAGSFDTYTANIMLGRSLGKGWSSTIFADYTSSQGAYDFDIENAEKRINGKRINSDIETLRADVSFLWNGNKKNFFRAKLYAYNSSQGIPGGVIVDNPISSERLTTRNLFGQLFYECFPSSGIRMKAALKHNYQYNRNKQPTLKTINEYNQHETDLSYTVAYSPTEILSFAYSEELFYNNLKTTNRHNTMPSSPQRISLLSAVSMRVANSLFSVTASLLHSYASEWCRDAEAAPDRSRFSPSLSFSCSPFGKNSSLRLSYKEIFRMPTFNDLYYRESGNYKLRPEKSRMLNIGASYMSSGNAAGNLLFSIDGYYGRVEDKIVAVPGIFIWKMSNVNDVKLSGADLNISGTINLPAHSLLKIASSYSYMCAVDDTGGSQLKGSQIVYTPRHSGSLSAALETAIVNFGYSLIWSGKRYRLAQNIPSTEVDPYFDHSLWLSRDWKIANATLSTKIEAINITDINYEIIRYYPMPGCNCRITAILKI